MYNPLNTPQPIRTVGFLPLLAVLTPEIIGGLAALGIVTAGVVTTQIANKPATDASGNPTTATGIFASKAGNAVMLGVIAFAAYKILLDKKK